ncbi:MAG: HNH endonuclease [Firmicutes bacterium]|nr:HNH endonuclease [Bacillota bacterium]
MKLKNKEKVYIYNRENKKCFFCKKKLKFRQVTLDHYLPLSKDGTDEVFNLVVSCRKCNKLKDNKVPIDYERVLIELFLKAVEDGMIIGKNLKIDNNKLKKELLKINRIEDINNYFIFQSKNKRYYIKNGYVVKRIFLGGNYEYYDNFSW